MDFTEITAIDKLFLLDSKRLDHWKSRMLVENRQEDELDDGEDLSSQSEGKGIVLEEEEEILNLVGFASGTEEDKTLCCTDSEDEDEEIDPKKEYRILYDSWVDLSNDNLDLVNEKAKLKAQVLFLQKEASSIQKDHLTKGSTEAVSQLQYQYKLEKEKSERLQRELDETYKKVRMMNHGTEKLDKILTMGRTDDVHRGLGYNGCDSTHSLSDGMPIKFVSKGTMVEE